MSELLLFFDFLEEEEFGRIEMEDESILGYDECVVPYGHSGYICRNNWIKLPKDRL